MLRRTARDGSSPWKERDLLNPDERAIVAARAADERKARDVLVLDVGGMTPMADYFVVASGETSTQVRAISESVRLTLRERGGGTPRREGDANTRWVLLDYGDVVIHIFRQAEREYYDLERLWADAPRVNWAAHDVPANGTADPTSVSRKGSAE